jgi:VIT1/CCC1 family predicted Fe2+/Mn2+ transporter
MVHSTVRVELNFKLRRELRYFGFIALLGAIGTRAGGANVLRGTARVTFWGALAMAITAGIGKLFGTIV